MEKRGRGCAVSLISNREKETEGGKKEREWEWETDWLLYAMFFFYNTVRPEKRETSEEKERWMRNGRTIKSTNQDQPSNDVVKTRTMEIETFYGHSMTHTILPGIV